jgi:hypothetical protein
MLRQMGDQAAASLIENSIKAIAANKMTASSDAAKAARRAFLAGEATLPGVPGVILGGVLGASTFAAMMAFEEGGIVPGVGKGDIVPAKLEPGEGVLSNKVMDGLRNVSRGNGSSGKEIHIHHSPTYHVQTIDGDGIRGMLQKHSSEFVRHAHSHLRKMNQ